MAEQFEDQGGAASSNPPAVLRWATSKVLSRIAPAAAQRRRRARREAKRRKAGARHAIHYFHQVEDPYSHLAAQLLSRLREQYDIDLVCHLVNVPRDANLPEPDLLPPLARRDAALVAPHYGLEFSQSRRVPGAEQIDLGERVLARVSQDAFPRAAVGIGEALWSGDAARLEAEAAEFGAAARDETDRAIERGNAQRAEFGHYSAAMFYCDGEWYWGADRFYHLENRLIEAGVRREDNAHGGAASLICPRPAIELGPHKDDGSLELEFYPSLRSPYTSLIFDETIELAKATGVRLSIRPVLPMVMRGVSITRQKGLYIFKDAAREADALGIEWGRTYDPIGDPVRNCYSLYPWAVEQGKGTLLLSGFLRAAFREGINTNNIKGLRRVVEGAGLPWSEAQAILGNRDWEAQFEENRLAMYGFGSWGVPSYRLFDANGGEVLGVWGQDRLWLVAREIQRLLGERANSPPSA